MDGNRKYPEWINPDPKEHAWYELTFISHKGQDTHDTPQISKDAKQGGTMR